MPDYIIPIFHKVERTFFGGSLVLESVMTGGAVAAEYSSTLDDEEEVTS